MDKPTWFEEEQVREKKAVWIGEGLLRIVQALPHVISAEYKPAGVIIVKDMIYYSSFDEMTFALKDCQHSSINIPCLPKAALSLEEIDSLIEQLKEYQSGTEVES